MIRHGQNEPDSWFGSRLRVALWTWTGEEQRATTDGVDVAVEVEDRRGGCMNDVVVAGERDEAGGNGLPRSRRLAAAEGKNLVEGVPTLWMKLMRCKNLVEGVPTLWMKLMRCKNLVEGVPTLWMKLMRCQNLVEGVPTLWMKLMRCKNLVEGVPTLWISE
ncbi:hypothetical protein LR48_Vigan04g057500 [Vigna angularis]|uniref:Uncharacterized protein n=1 Tax=Phaseolus angularis TaxID=3914 RepID=A0A0L9UCU1_PHAAN|nr:hypothetical protein LR48_Vigan04g057500 [Vigna angularis]